MVMTDGTQKPFEKMIVMQYECVGIGMVKMTPYAFAPGLRSGLNLVFYILQYVLPTSPVRK